MRGLRLDVKGKRFGRLVAVADVGVERRGRRLWHCECDCGGFRKVTAIDLLHTGVKSCGCVDLRVGRAMAREGRKHVEDVL